MFRSSLIIALTCILAVPAGAHHSPPTVTEIEWNAESQRFEVAMRLSIPDLQDAISAKLNRRFRLDGAADRDEQIRRYIGENFSVTFDGDDECRLRWVGVELQLHDVWVYFEAESVGDFTPQKSAPSKTSTNKSAGSWDGFLKPQQTTRGIRDVVVQNECLLKVRPGQQNVVRFKSGSLQKVLTLTAKTPRLSVR